MYRSSIFILFMKLYLIITIIEIESISDQTSWNYNEDLLGKIYDYYSDNKIIETHPIKEGFILLKDNSKNFPSIDISSTIYKTITVTKTTADTSSPESSSIQTTKEDDVDEIKRFLRIHDEVLNKALTNDEITFDGSGDTTEPTIETTTMSTISTTSRNITTELTSVSTTTLLTTNSTSVPVDIILSGYSTFIITVYCTNASSILNNILEQFNKTFSYNYNFTYNEIPNICRKLSNININITFLTDNNITILTNLFRTLENIVSNMGIILQSFNRCGTSETVIVENFTPCYLIDLCNLCGINPRRGICIPEDNVSKCQCFANENNPTILYTGEFCQIQQTTLTTPISSSSWSTILIGILAGIAGLFCATTICFLIITFIRRRRRHFEKDNNNFDQNDTQVSRFSYIPRAKLPTIVTNENNPILTLDTNPNIFFQELDQNLIENQRTIIPRLNPKSLIRNTRSETISIKSIYDPINELDTIINDEDISMTF